MPPRLTDMLARMKALPTPAQMENNLLGALFPEIISSKLPADVMKIAEARKMIQTWAALLLTELGAAVSSLQERENGRDEAIKNLKDEVKAAKDETARAQIVITDLRRDLSAAQELRGTFESKRVADLERALAAKEREVEALNEKLRNRDEVVQRLTNELNGRMAMIDGYERDITQLTTAAAANAERSRQEQEALNRSILAARASLTNARNNIDDRWGNKAGPFIDLIKGDIIQALAKLPPLTSP